MKSSISSVPILSSLQRSSKLTSDVDSPSDMNVKTRILCTLFSWNKPGKKIKDLDVPLSYFATYYKYIKWFTIISPPNHLAINEIATKKSADSWPSFFFKLINPSPSLPSIQQQTTVPKYTVALNNETGQIFQNSVDDVFFNRKRFTL